MTSNGIHIGVLAAHSPEMAPEELEAFAMRLGERVAPLLDEAGGVPWTFHRETSTRLVTDDPRHPALFLDEASLRMVEGPYDAVVVVTDVGLVSRNHRVVPGLVSSVGRVLILSTRKLRVSPRGEPPRELTDDVVLDNATTLLLHLIGHAAGLDHAPAAANDVMSPFAITDDRRALPTFGARARSRLPQLARRFPEREAVDEGLASEIGFHLSAARRHPRQVLAAVWRSRAPLLPLFLPRLTTAAVAPAVILVFTAEIWDAGFHMTDRGVWLFAAWSVVLSAVYLLTAQSLFLPHKEKRLHTEHLAVVNVVLVLVILLAVAGLFVMLGLLMLAVQTFIFPPDLIREWPSLELSATTITFTHQLRIAALISTIGVITGALAGGLERRDVLRQLALFQREP